MNTIIFIINKQSSIQLTLPIEYIVFIVSLVIISLFCLIGEIIWLKSRCKSLKSAVDTQLHTHLNKEHVCLQAVNNNSKQSNINIAEQILTTSLPKMKAIKKTDIPAHRVGKRWMFDKAELEAWVKSGKSAN